MNRSHKRFVCSVFTLVNNGVVMNDGFIVVVVGEVVANEVVIVDDMKVGTVADANTDDGVDEDEAGIDEELGRERDETDDDNGDEEEDDMDDDDAYNEVVAVLVNIWGACVVETFIAGVCKAGGNKEVVSDLDNSAPLTADSKVLATGVMVRASN